MKSAIHGPLPKPPDQRLRRNKRNDAGVLVAVSGEETPVPEPHERWAPSVKQAWNDYWHSPVVRLASPESDMSALRRLFDYKHEFQVAIKAYQNERITYGSIGQRRLSPMFDAMTKLEKLMTPLEDRFGMTPAGRLRLGATLGEASKSLSEMNAALDQEVVGDPDDDDDPRNFLEVPAN